MKTKSANKKPVVPSKAMKNSKVCSVAGCPKPARTKGMCPAHYARKLRGVEVVTPIRTVDTRLDATERIHSVFVSPRTLTRLTKLARAASVGTTVYIGQVLDNFAKNMVG